MLFPVTPTSEELETPSEDYEDWAADEAPQTQNGPMARLQAKILKRWKEN